MRNFPRKSDYPCCAMSRRVKNSKNEFVEYQNLYALLNLGHQVQDKTIGKQKYDCFICKSNTPWCGSVGHAGIGYAVCYPDISRLHKYIDILVCTAWASGVFYRRMWWTTLYTPAGQAGTQLVLQDGTEVWLNAKSKLIYPASFTDDKRNVTIERRSLLQSGERPLPALSLFLRMMSIWKF